MQTPRTNWLYKYFMQRKRRFAFFLCRELLFGFSGKQKERRSSRNWIAKCKKRLKLQYPDTHDLKIESEGNIYKVSLKLKLSNENDQ